MPSPVLVLFSTNRDIGCWQGIQNDGEGGGASGLGGRAGDGGDGDARHIVIGVGGSYINRINPVVVGIPAGRRSGGDGVGSIAIYGVIIHAGDGDGLGSVPVCSGKDDGGRRNGTFGGICAAQTDGDIRGGLAGQRDGKGGLSIQCSFGGNQARCRGNSDAKSVVIGVGDGYIVGILTIILVAAGTDGGSGDDLVIDVAIIYGVIHAGDGDKLGKNPSYRR